VKIFWTYLVVAVPALILALSLCRTARRRVTRKLPWVNTCGDATCEACVLLSGGWPKYNPGPRQREGMGLRRAQKQWSAHVREFEEAREVKHA